MAPKKAGKPFAVPSAKDFPGNNRAELFCVLANTRNQRDTCRRNGITYKVKQFVGIVEDATDICRMKGNEHFFLAFVPSDKRKKSQTVEVYFCLRSGDKVVNHKIFTVFLAGRLDLPMDDEELLEEECKKMVRHTFACIHDNELDGFAYENVRSVCLALRNGTEMQQAFTAVGIPDYESYLLPVFDTEAIKNALGGIVEFSAVVRHPSDGTVSSGTGNVATANLSTQQPMVAHAQAVTASAKMPPTTQIVEADAVPASTLALMSMLGCGIESNRKGGEQRDKIIEELGKGNEQRDKIIEEIGKGNEQRDVQIHEHGKELKEHREELKEHREKLEEHDKKQSATDQLARGNSERLDNIEKNFEKEIEKSVRKQLKGRKHEVEEENCEATKKLFNGHQSVQSGEALQEKKTEVAVLTGHQPASDPTAALVAPTSSAISATSSCGPDSTASSVVTGTEANTVSPSSIVVLTTSSGFCKTQTNNQQHAKTILDAQGISYAIIDGCDPSNKTTRDDLFAVAEVRGYPLFFRVENGKLFFLGGWARFTEINDASSLSTEFLDANPTIMTWERLGLVPAPGSANVEQPSSGRQVRF